MVTGPVDSPVTGGEDVPLAGSSSEPGIAFPYARELKAMHAAAMKYWADYTPDKRQPTQKEIGIEIGELLDLSLQSNNEPARKAKYWHQLSSPTRYRAIDLMVTV